MRIALVSPYSWTYPGGVNRHVESLAEELIGRDHHVRVLAPVDPPDAVSRRLHRLPAEPRELPDWLIPLGRTIGVGANGAVSNLSIFPSGTLTLRRSLEQGRFDVVHVHEPAAPLIAWDACTFRAAPVVGTFHAYSTRPVPNGIANLLGARRLFNQLSARIAVSEAAAWTGRRWFGGEYEIVPNGVDLASAPAPRPRTDDGPLRLLFVGRAEERKGLGVLLSAFGALVDHVPAELTVVGAERDEVERLAPDDEVVASARILGRVSGDDLWRELRDADLLCAPSLEGESFGMVLTEAFAAGTPVVASEIAGYSDVVTDGVDGVLVPPADPQRLGEVLRDLATDPERVSRMGEAGRRSAERYAWPRVADQVERVYESALVPTRAPAGRLDAAARRVGFAPIDGSPPVPPKRMPSLDPQPKRGRAQLARRIGLVAIGALGLGLTALAAHKIGLARVAGSIISSDLSWLAVACALMVASLFARAESWRNVLLAALPGRKLRRRDCASATMIGVFMSATLPARLGEPARALVISRRIGRVRETFAVVVGTLVSQTAMNLLALGILGVVIVATSDLFQQSTQRLFLASLVPVCLLLAVIAAPVVFRGNGNGGRLARAVAAVRRALAQVRSGLAVFRSPKLASLATADQLLAWALQLGACWALFAALGLDADVGIGAAAAVLFAVNVTAVVPATPSNVGIFQLAVISVLTAGFGVDAASALAYGLVLQAVEVATAAVLGLPSLVREGVSWSDMRLRALQAAPVTLAPPSRESPATERASAG